jgi:addiction module HigA family antidote
MILGFGDAETEKVWRGETSRRLPHNMQPVARRKLRIEGLIRQTSAIDADMALRLARYFGTSERFWIGLQADFDLEEAAQAATADIASIHPLAA